LFGPSFEPWIVMILPPGGFLSLGFLLLFFNWLKQRQEQKQSLVYLADAVAEVAEKKDSIISLKRGV